jgi:hypothetical protein
MRRTECDTAFAAYVHAISRVGTKEKWTVYEAPDGTLFGWPDDLPPMLSRTMQNVAYPRNGGFGICVAAIKATANNGKS